jgi:LPS-assembly protein
MLLLCALTAGAQVAPVPPKPVRPNAPKPTEILVRAVTQEVDGSMHRLRGAAEIETTEMLLRADEIDYDEKNDYAEARGNVRFDHFERGEHIEADRVEYHLSKQQGRFYNVRGSSPAKLEARPGVLTTTSPFSFEGKWAERIENRYILHDGFITNCKIPRPWWVLRAREFDIIPGDRAIARNSTFWLRKIPLLFAPKFYKALDRAPRKSGFLTPTFGNSSRRGLMAGGGYYWAINRSYDATYRSQWFRTRGFAHHVDIRGKPAQKTDFNFILYGVDDKGPVNDDGSRGESQGGYMMSLTGRSELPGGWRARGEFNYLDSFTFRQAFTESYYEAVYSEVHSRAHLSKYWSDMVFHLAASRFEAFQWAAPQEFPSTRSENKVSLRKLPSAEFNSRDRQINDRILPVWISWNSSVSFLRRHETYTYDSGAGLVRSELETAQFVDRLDFEPRIMTALRWKDISLIPAFSIRETRYGSSLDSQGKVTGQSLLRSSTDFSADLILPSFSRIFESPPRWLGAKLKHAIETRASFQYVDGIGSDFHRIIRFDETDILSDTNQADITLTNRLFSKTRDGNVSEILSWDLTQRWYFDPDFGGAVDPGRRNVLLSTGSLTGLAFLDVSRSYSPLISSLRGWVHGVGFEWRTDYDPLRNRFVNSSFSANGRISQNYFVQVAHNTVRSVPVTSDKTTLDGLSPTANQISSTFGFGQENRRGVSAGTMLVYDYTRNVMLFNQTQVTYNTDCCGWSIQYRRFGFGDRNENQFRVAFAIANIGSFGTLKRQERIF